MRSELSGEDWQIVQAVLNGTELHRAHAGFEANVSSEDQLFEQENIRLHVAEATLTAATTGGHVEWGTNESQVFRAVSEMRRIWQDRINRAEGAGDNRKRQEYEQRWDARRRDIVAFIPSEMNEESADYRRVRLLTMGDLNPADEVYLAGEGLDYDRVVSLVSQYWAEGKMADLLTQSQQGRRDESGGTIRPSFRVWMIIPSNLGINSARVAITTRPDLDDSNRGARRLGLEIDEGTSDSDLRKAFTLLTSHGISAGLRNSAIEQFASNRLSNENGDSATQKFLAYISRRYEDSITVYDFRDLLDPSNTPEVMTERARGRLAASRSGVMDISLRNYVLGYDLLSGEDTEQVVVESLARLQFIANQTGARPAELEAMLAITGAANRDALATLEYTAFRDRLEELRQLKQAIAEAIATVVEIAVEAVLTIATGGVAGGMLLASLAAAVTAMLLREALLGQDYDLVSRENAQQLATILASHGFGSLGRGILNDVISPDNLRQLSHAQTFFNEAAVEAFSQVNVQILTAGLEGRLPTAENISASALAIVGNSLGAGAQGRLSRSIDENSGTIERFRRSSASEITQSLVSGASEEGAEMIRTGTGDLSGVDIGMRFLRRAAEDVGRGLTTSVRNTATERLASPEGEAEAPTPSRPESEADVPMVPRPEGEVEAPTGRRPGNEVEILSTPRPEVVEVPITEPRTEGEFEVHPGPRPEIEPIDLPHDPRATSPPDLPESIARVRTATVVIALPDGTVVMPPVRRNGSIEEHLRYLNDVHTIYGNMRRDDPRNEVAVYRNSETGEFIIIQGDNRHVTVARSEGEAEAPGRGGVSQQWKEILDGLDVGNWILEAHSHPVDPETGSVVDANRLPSGANGDFGGVIYASQVTGQPHSSRIDYETAQGSNHTEYGYDPSRASPFWVSYPEPGTERRQVIEFETFEDYHSWLRQTFGVEPGLVPDRLSLLEQTSPRAQTRREEIETMMRELGGIPSEEDIQTSIKLSMLIRGEAPILTGLPTSDRGRRSPLQTGRGRLRRRMVEEGRTPSWALDEPGGGWDAHHVIPWSLRYNSAFDILRSTGGWDHNDLRNSIALPTRPDIPNAGGLPVHQGEGILRFHEVYSGQIEEKLTNLANLYEHDPSRLLSEVLNLIDVLTSQMFSGEWPSRILF